MTTTSVNSTAAATDSAVPAPARRIDLGAQAPDFYQAMGALDKASREGLDPVLSELVRTRISQVNGCAFCVDMHHADARKAGVTEQKMAGLTVWRETPFYTARERAALALAEAVTEISGHGVPDAVYDEAAALFDQGELSRLIALCVVMNSWNRIGITSRMSPEVRA